MVMVTMNYTTTAASIIPDTPIVSIAGSTLSEITTTTTSTKTTPTPVPTSNDTNKRNSSSKTKETADDKVKTEISYGALSNTAEVASPPILKSSAILLKLMSDTNLSSVEADNNSSKQHNLNNSIIPSTSLIKSTNHGIKFCHSNTSKKDLPGVNHNAVEAVVAPADVSATITENDVNDTNLVISKPTVAVNSASAINTKKASSKEKSLSGSWEECRLKDWDDNQLKELLEEAYHYKNPRDKENKSKAFLQLLEKAESEDASYPFGALTPRPLSNSITSTNYYNYHKANAYHHTAYSSHNSNSKNNNNCSNNNNHNNNNINNSNNNSSHHRSLHHTHKQGGSLQDLFNEAQLDCDHTFGSTNNSAVGGGNQKGRRQNHNSRQKKYSGSVSSRQREGGSLPSNVNVTYQLSTGTTTAAATAIGSARSGGAYAVDTSSHLNTTDCDFFHELNAPVAKLIKKEQRRFAKTNTGVITAANTNKNNNNNNINNICNNDDDKPGNNQVLTAANQSGVGPSSTQACPQSSDGRPIELRSMNPTSTTKTIKTEATPNSTVIKTRDCIIEIGEPIMNVQQQQQILMAKGQDAETQGILPTTYYENMANTDGQVPRVNFVKTKCSSFAPTTYHCYVDETVKFTSLESVGGSSGNGIDNDNDNSGAINIRTTGNKSQKKTAIDSNTVMSATASGVGSAAAATTTTAAIINTNKYLPLDETYKSCLSVLGTNVGDTVSDKLGLKSKCITTGSKTLLPNIQSPLSSGSALAGLNVQQHQPSFDENGNALSEFYQSVANMSAGSAIHLGVPPPVTLANISTSATVSISVASHTTSSSVSASACIANALNCSSNVSGGGVGLGVSVSGSAGTPHIKSKGKKKSLQERNTKTVDVESVAGYRGNDPVEELVKYIESGEGGNSSIPSKGADKKRDRRKDKEKHQKLKKSNSLEELRSGAKLDLQEMKRTAATTDTNTIVMRQKQSNKQNKQNSSSTADIHKSSDNNKSQNNNSHTNNSHHSSNHQLMAAHSITGGTYKSDRRSWGIEELKCMQYQQHQTQQQHVYGKDVDQKVEICGSTSTSSAAVNNVPTSTITTKERQKVKSNVKQIDIKEKDRDNKETTKDKTKEYNEVNLSTNNNIIVQEQQQKHQHVSIEHNEKQMFSGKLDKVETKTVDDKMDKRKKDVPSNAVTIVDILSMESVLPETAEFHVVTKRKKPKKQKANSNADETTVTLSRSQNFSMPKPVAGATSNNSSQGQNSGRYRHQSHEIQPSCQIGGTIQENRHNASVTSRGGGGSGNAIGNGSNDKTKNKSRRKSTSSMPSSEKSDLSDQDSVHSLPIESTANVIATAKVITTTGAVVVPFITSSVSATAVAASSSTTTTTLSAKVAQNKRNKSAKQTQQIANISSHPNSVTTSTNKTTTNVPLAPISYADIARNKDIKISDTQTEISHNSTDGIAQYNNSSGLLNTYGSSGGVNYSTNANAPIVTDDESKVQVVAATNTSGKSHKIKKNLQKGSFPELRNNNNNHTVIVSNVPNSTNSNTLPSTGSVVDLQKQNQNQKFAGQTAQHSLSTSNRLNEICQNDDNNNINQASAATVDMKVQPHYPQHQQQQQQHSQPTHVQNMAVSLKAKSIEHYDSFNQQQQQQQQSMHYNNNDNIAANAASTTTTANTSNHPGLLISSHTTTAYQVTNLDQQYPALEKTFKRHSNNNGANTNNSSNSNSNNNNNNNNSTAIAAAPITTLKLDSTNYVPTQNCVTITNTHNSKLSQFSFTSTSADAAIQANTLTTTAPQSSHIESSAFNFAGAANKKQSQRMITITSVGSNNGNDFQGNSNVKQIILTTSSSSRNNNNANTSNVNNTNVTNNNNNNNRKSKDKTPPVDNSLIAASMSSTTMLPPLLPNPTSMTITAAILKSHGSNASTTFSTPTPTPTPSSVMHHNCGQQDGNGNDFVEPQTTTALITTQVPAGLPPPQIQILRRSKKERQQQQLMYNVMSSNSKRIIGNSNNNNNNNIENSNKSSNSSNNISTSQQYSPNRLTKSQLRSSSVSSTNDCSSSIKGGSDNSFGNNDQHQLLGIASTINSNNNRPPAVIMRDDGSRRISNEIIFGDFGEEVRELLFQDLKLPKNDFTTSTSMAPANCENSVTSPIPLDNSINYPQDEPLGLINADTPLYTTQGHYIMQPLQNSSLTAAGGQSHPQYNDSAAYIYPHEVSEGMVQHIERQQPYSSSTVDDGNVHYILPSNADDDENMSNNMDGCMAEIPLPQQLETCNDIETAIIAAARAQQRYQEHEQQQLHYRNSKSCSNSSSYSSSSIAITSNTIPHNYVNSQMYNPSNTYNNHSNSYYGQRRRSLSGHGKRGGGGYRQIQSQSMQQHQQSQPQLYEFHNEGIVNKSISYIPVTSTDRAGIDLHNNNTNLCRSAHSPSRMCCILISQTNGPYKEVHFVQSPAPPLTYNQHRRHDQLVDFISSSWDDILNSNGTRMYIDNK